MYKCNDCGALFEEPHAETFCYEEELGVASLFSDKHYGIRKSCPYCGSGDYIYQEDDDDFE